MPPEKLAQHMVHLGVFGHWDCTDPPIAWHQLVETYIEASGITWTHIHPNMFMEQIPKFMKIRNDRFSVFWGSDRMGWIAWRDIGAVAATVLREGPAKRSGQNYWLSAEVDGEKRRLMLAALRYLDMFVKLNGAWLCSERLLYVDWTEERTLS